jgi:hypothetical protein
VSSVSGRRIVFLTDDGFDSRFAVVPLQHQGDAKPSNDNNQGETATSRGIVNPFGYTDGQRVGLKLEHAACYYGSKGVIPHETYLMKNSPPILTDLPGMTQGVGARVWRMGAALLLVLPLAVVLLGLLAARAEAEPRIKINCEIYSTNRVDPIAHTLHLHHHFGNTSTTNSSTAKSLFNRHTTSCNKKWFTSAGWFPVERGEPVLKVAVYYRAPGNQKQVRAIPKGLQLVGGVQEYSCNKGPFRNRPPYGCTKEWATRVIFPDCWDKKSLQEGHTVYSNARGQCPRSHPYRIPKINYLIRHPNRDGKVSNPLRVSAGVNAWAPWRHMHGDYFAANQPVLNRKLLGLCLRNAPDRVTVAHPKCGKGP